MEAAESMEKKADSRYDITQLGYMQSENVGGYPSDERSQKIKEYHTPVVLAREWSREQWRDYVWKGIQLIFIQCIHKLRG